MQKQLLIFLFLFYSCILYNQNEVGIGIATPNSTLHLYGLGTVGGGSRLAFGDDVSGGHRVFAAEYNWLSNTDSDALELRGEMGIYFTRGISSTPVVSGYFDGGGILRLNNVNTDATANNILVRQADGAIAQRALSTLLQVATENSSLQRIGVRNSNPEFTFDIVHANGTPAPGSSDPHNGLNIRHEGSNNENWTLYVSNADGDLEFYNQGIKEVEFTDDGAINTLSDERAKKNIQNLNNVLPSILNISPKTYVYKHSRSGRTSYGFLAQDVEKIFPDFVKKGSDNVNDDTYSLSYLSFIPVLVKGIQEQQAVIEKQETEIQDLQKKYDAILKKLESLETFIKTERK